MIEPEPAPNKPLVSSGKMESLRPVNGVERFKFQGRVPEGFHLVVNTGLLNAGIITFAVAWLPFAVGALITRSPLLRIPFAGPLAGYRREGFVSPGIEILIVTILVMDVVAQVGGVTLLLAGAISPTRWLERDARISLVPTAPGAALGASLVGRY